MIPGSRYTGLKSQFVKINALQGKGSQSEQSQLPNGGSGADTQSTVPFDQLHARKTPLGQTTHSPGNGLLYGDARNSLSPHPNAISGQISVAEQNTLKQQAMIGPITDPARNVNHAQAQMLAYGQMPLSPYQSGITPFAAMNPTSQSLQPPQTPSIQYPGMQQLSPINGSTPLSQPLMNPMPGFMPMPLSPMPMNYQGAGGFPPGYSSLPPGIGKPGNNRKKRRFPIWARIAVPVFLLLLIVVGGLAGYYYYNFSAPVSHIVGQQVTRLKGDEDPNANRNGADILSGPRINILLLGSDTDQKFTNADGSHNYLAQSDIVVTIDPATKSVGMLSIPRDFWINVPGSGLHKLDEAYSLGGPAIGTGAYSPGGVALSRLTIFQDFGIPINYYAWVGLDGFVKVIDTVGGVDVDVLHPITDDNYPDDVGNNTGDLYAYKRLYIPPGPQHLSGSEALEYVRSRHADLVGDFGRSARQQQVLSALKTKLDNPDIVSKLPEIATDLNGYVKTDMQLSDVFKLMNFARSLNSNSINRVILGPPYSSDGTTPDGTSVVFPDCGKIVPVIAQMFALGDKAACNIQANSSNNALASASQPSSTSNNSANTNSLQAMSQIASASALNLSGGSDNLSGFHSLLDLMFMVVLESPQAMQA
jgi:LCP family protein required for cell wall assembly